MFKKLVICAIMALGVASAASYRLTISQPSVVKGAQLKPGDYRLNVENNKATFVGGKQPVEVSVKIENSDQKFDQTAVRYGANGSIIEIRLGGGSTRLVFTE